jgi:hypothetical protein
MWIEPLREMVRLFKHTRLVGVVDSEAVIQGVDSLDWRVVLPIFKSSDYAYFGLRYSSGVLIPPWRRSLGFVELRG